MSLIAILIGLLVGLVTGAGGPGPVGPPTLPPAPGVSIEAPPSIGYDQTLVVTVRGLTPGGGYTVETEVVGIPHTDCTTGDEAEGVALEDGTMTVRMARRGWPDLWCTGSDYAGTVRATAGGQSLGSFTVTA
jgi:hypothetical protein